jgi:hypothetical protein
MRFQQIIDNDKEVAGYTLHVLDWGEEGPSSTRVGDGIGCSTRLRWIEVHEFLDPPVWVFDEDDNDYNRHRLQFDWLHDVFRGLARNRSIEHFTLHDVSFPWSPFERLSPFFEHNHNLRYASN